MIYEFITHSDPITFVSENEKVAFFCSLLLGNGKAGIRKENEQELELSPMFLFHPDPMPVIEKYLGCNIDEFVDKNSESISKCFTSFAYGSIEDRKAFDDAILSIDDPEKLKQFKLEHEDRNRTSFSQWVKAAWQYGENFANPVSS